MPRGLAADLTDLKSLKAFERHSLTHTKKRINKIKYYVDIFFKAKDSGQRENEYIYKFHDTLRL